ncbi:uncharacterized protein SCHCODRAFT_02323626 [Schizophyllum commune H4-8]|uniref:uncharacterized protein n=1 Tax=Schizophyllum commune (strain H4-8 / FGSC 9210) TaxID=578458 RepID=UPI00215F1D7E|nr:uncharacterized protein SCHCODRAFT_02323626 [Schizophyllum commune H4-8]KAI5891595.1 hypothetical protein SCHCODRAFT_02323626 [Schizophyllum commune H4-8]
MRQSKRYRLRKLAFALSFTSVRFLASFLHCAGPETWMWVERAATELYHGALIRGRSLLSFRLPLVRSGLLGPKRQVQPRTNRLPFPTSARALNEL